MSQAYNMVTGYEDRQSSQPEEMNVEALKQEEKRLFLAYRNGNP